MLIKYNPKLKSPRSLKKVNPSLVKYEKDVLEGKIDIGMKVHIVSDGQEVEHYVVPPPDKESLPTEQIWEDKQLKTHIKDMIKTLFKAIIKGSNLPSK
tara:strand:+ start:50 stop:343 length:294 start_codon:yes stop_codon:yes gene_type:complete